MRGCDWCGRPAFWRWSIWLGSSILTKGRFRKRSVLCRACGMNAGRTLRGLARECAFEGRR